MRPRTYALICLILFLLPVSSQAWYPKTHAWLLAQAIELIKMIDRDGMYKGLTTAIFRRQLGRGAWREDFDPPVANSTGSTVAVNRPAGSLDPPRAKRYYANDHRGKVRKASRVPAALGLYSWGRSDRHHECGRGERGIRIAAGWEKGEAWPLRGPFRPALRLPRPLVFRMPTS
jgi:hypothetical protein